MSNFLDKLVESELVKGLLSRDRSVLGVDIGSSAIKVVQLTAKGGHAVLENYGELALGSYAGLQVGQATNLSKAKIKEALTDLFKEANITVRKAAISIPMGSTLLVLIEIPKIDKKKVDSLVPNEARKYIPVPVSEVTLDWWVLPEKNKSYMSRDIKEEEGEEKGGKKIEMMQILLAAIHNDMIQKYQDIRDSVGLESSLFEIDIFSSIRAVVGKEDDPVMVLDMGAGTTKLAVIDFGVLQMQHIINMGSQDITVTLSKMKGVPIPEAEKLKRDFGLSESEHLEKITEAASFPLNHVFAEVNKVLLNYKKKSSRQIAKVIFTGGGSLMKGMIPYAKDHLDVDVEIGAPFSRIETPVFLENTLKEAGPEFAVAIGLALKALRE